ncbi:MAG: hypothetical protein ABIP97_08125 [Chthoniobacterales bacterium]
MSARICLITPSHPCSNPRLVKEADALQEAGYSVHVIASRYMPALDVFDRPIYKNAKWTHTIVDQTGSANRIKYGIQRKVARLLPEITHRIPLLAHHPPARDMLPAAIAQPADLYIGHVLAGLPIAVAAAKHHRARAGFDAEDFHSEEVETTDAADLLSRQKLERLFNYCRHRTAASPQIAQAYEQIYGGNITSILNVFPLAIAPAKPHEGSNSSSGTAIRFYWFSQTVGPARGIEKIAPILNRLSFPWQLDLRGWCDDAYKAQLRALFGDRVRILPPEPPEEMIRLAAEYDAGLSLELTVPRNRDLCLTNKIFTYLLAGIPVILSKTTAQCALAAELGDAAAVIDFNDIDKSAQTLEDFFGDDSRRKISRDHAWHLGQTRFNWDAEKIKFLQTIEHSLAS